MPVIKSPLSDVTIPEVPLHTAIFGAMSTHTGKTALIDGMTGKKYSYEEVLDNCQRVASGLHKLGVRKGDTLAIFSPNTPEWVFVFYGAMATGCRISTVNPVYTKYELAHHLKDSGAQYVYTTSELAATVRGAEKEGAGHVKAVITLGDAAGTIPLSRLLADDRSRWPEVAQTPFSPRDDVATLPYSSGTTGLPKGVMITHYNLVSQIIQYTHPGMIDPAAADPSAPPNVVMALLPFYHAYGMVAILALSLAGGSTLVILPRFIPETFFSAIEKYKVTILPLVPPIVVYMAKSPLLAKYDLSSVVRVGCGAAPLASDTEGEFKRRMKIDNLRQAFGMTETTLVAIQLNMTSKLVPGSVGQLMPNTEAQVVDPETGVSLGANQRGELWLRGPQIMKGYLNKPEATKATLTEDGWLKTGDIGYYDNDGYFYIVDRMKELIKYKGLQVAPAELEALLLNHPKVGDVGVVGIPDPAAGELPKAYVVAKPGVRLTESELVDYVNERVAHFKQLRGGVEFLDEIPKSPSGKILRRLLRDRPKSKL